MDSIIFVINKTYDLLQVRLVFGSFTLTPFAIIITFASISLAGAFFKKFFSV